MKFKKFKNCWKGHSAISKIMKSGFAYLKKYLLWKTHKIIQLFNKLWKMQKLMKIALTSFCSAR